MTQVVKEKGAAKKPLWKKIMNTILIVLGALLGVIVLAAAGYVYNNLNFYKGPLQETAKAGFHEKQVTLPDGSVLNYAEGPDNGPALLLLHGQMVAWQDYAPVLPQLSKVYHVFAVDYYGQGKSSKNPAKYSAEAIGKDLARFIENIIGEPAVVSGHSSGGLLTVWLAANAPEDVRGVVLEDPPLFSTEVSYPYQKTFAWVDSFEPIHRYLNQSEEKDFVLFYLRNSAWVRFFGNGRDGLLKYAASYRAQHPGQKMEFFFLPPSINNVFLYAEDYDPRFGDTFYDTSWNQNFDHAEALARIQAPSVLIHTNWSYNQDGVLMAAMSGPDAERAHELIRGNELINVNSGHDVHFEHPQEFVKIMTDFLEKVKE
jgi:pimeloyl-ACP methyl ester carboxylesterase